MKTLTVLYFGLLREQRGLAEESLTTRAVNVSELFAELKARHGLGMSFSQLKAARNEEFCEGSTALATGDVIALMPPVAGG